VNRFSVEGSKERYFELHDLVGGELNIVSFLAETQAAEVAQLDGVLGHKLTLFAVKAPQATALIAIPVSRIVDANIRYIEFDTNTKVPAIECTVR